MRKQSMFIGMICLIASFILVSCDFGANDTVQDIKSEINQETPKEDIEESRNNSSIWAKVGDELAISSNFFWICLCDEHKKKTLKQLGKQTLVLIITLLNL